MKKTTIALIIAVLSATVGFIAVSMNVSASANMKQAIEEADGKSLETLSQITDLRNFSASHIGASTTLELTASYNRAVTSAQAAATAATKVTSDVYEKAQATCNVGRVDSIAQAKCVQAYVTSHSIRSKWH